MKEKIDMYFDGLEEVIKKHRLEWENVYIIVLVFLCYFALISTTKQHTRDKHYNRVEASSSNSVLMQSRS